MWYRQDVALEFCGGEACSADVRVVVFAGNGGPVLTTSTFVPVPLLVDV